VTKHHDTLNQALVAVATHISLYKALNIYQIEKYLERTLGGGGGRKNERKKEERRKERKEK
jgi:hypothetical protein